MYAAAEADSAAAGGSTGATGEADDDVVDAEIVDEPTDDGRAADGRRRRRPPRARTSDRPHAADEAVEPGRAGARTRPARPRRRPAEMASETEVEEVGGAPDADGDLDARGPAGRADRWTSSGSRPSTSTTSAGSTATASWCSENATYAALAPITEVLDTIDRAREHGELDGGFKAVAEQLERIVAGLGLVKFGAVGDPFDPTIHEALSHIGEDPDVEVTTCKVIAKAGYRIGDRVVRAAQVLVVDPVTGPGRRTGGRAGRAPSRRADGTDDSRRRSNDDE